MLLDSATGRLRLLSRATGNIRRSITSEEIAQVEQEVSPRLPHPSFLDALRGLSACVLWLSWHT